MMSRKLKTLPSGKKLDELPIGAGADEVDVQIVKPMRTHRHPVDILVNITGGPPPTPAVGQDLVLWRENFEAMILSVIAMTDRVLPGIRARKWGKVITRTSSGVVAPILNLGISSALRLALVGWSKTLAREVGCDGITCNIVLPG